MKPNAEKVRRFLMDPAYAAMVVRTNTKRVTRRARRSLAVNSPPPKLLIAQITQQCNRRCKMCNQWGDSGVFTKLEVPASEMSVEMYRNIYDQMKQYRPGISYLGGEPLIHRHFEEILRLTDSSLTPIQLETNGTRLSKHAKALVEAGVHLINVSIDGVEEVHDLIRGATGTFRKAVEGIHAIDEEKRRQGKSLPNVVVRCTITIDNYDRLEEGLDVIQSLPIQHFVIQHLMYTDDGILSAHVEKVKAATGFEIWRSDANPKLPKEIRAKSIVASLRSIAARKWPFGISFNPPYPLDYVETYYSNPAALPDAPVTCDAPWDQLVIDAAGQIVMCGNIRMGHVNDGPLMETWNTAVASKFRRLLAQKKSLPLCKVCCYPSE